MTRFISVLVTILFGLSSFGSEVWVTVPQLTTREKLERVTETKRAQIHDTDFISSFDAQISHPIAAAGLSMVLKMESDAQSASLNGHFARAITLYKELGAKLEGMPNVSGIERISLSVLIHLAELHDTLNDGEGQLAWKEAHAWHPNSLETTSEFSPRTIKKFNGVKTTTQNILEVIAPLESSVYIDGRRVDANESRFKKKLEGGRHQVSVLVPGSEWMTKKIKLSSGENRTLSFRPEPIVEGTCNDPHYIGTELPPKTKLLISFEDCDRVYFEKTWFTVTGRRMESLMPGSSVSTMTNEMLAPPEEKNWFSKLASSPWFWTGLGIVTVGAVAMAVQNQNQKTVVTPTNTFR